MRWSTHWPKNSPHPPALSECDKRGELDMSMAAARLGRQNDLGDGGWWSSWQQH